MSDELHGKPIVLTVGQLAEIRECSMSVQRGIGAELQLIAENAKQAMNALSAEQKDVWAEKIGKQARCVLDLVMRFNDGLTTTLQAASRHPNAEQGEAFIEPVGVEDLFKALQLLRHVVRNRVTVIAARADLAQLKPMPLDKNPVFESISEPCQTIRAHLEEFGRYLDRVFATRPASDVQSEPSQTLESSTPSNRPPGVTDRLDTLSTAYHSLHSRVNGELNLITAAAGAALAKQTLEEKDLAIRQIAEPCQNISLQMEQFRKELFDTLQQGYPAAFITAAQPPGGGADPARV